MDPIGEYSQSTQVLESVARSLYREGPWLLRMMMRYRLRICPFEKLLRFVPAGSSVLDVGCGAGLFMALTVSTVKNVTCTGFDSSRTAIAVADAMVERLESNGVRESVSVRYLSVEDPWPSGEFDVVSLIDVMHHIPRQAQKTVIAEAVRHVADGGILIYKDMANRPLFPSTMNRLHDLVLARQWIQYLPIETVEQYCSEFGLRVEERDEFSRYWYAHELRVFRKG